MTALYSFTIRDPATIQADWLRTWANGMKARGVANPNISKGSDTWIEALGFANEAAVVEANAVLKADQNLPDTATGTDLVRIGTMFGLSPRSAVGSVGNVTYSASASQFIAAGTILKDALAQRFQVVTGASYSNNDTMAVAAVDTGAATNHNAGDSLTWDNAPTYAQPTVVVSTGGLTGGADAESDSTYSARILSVLSNWPSAGNAQYVANLAEASSPAVQKGFVYPAAQGPATCHVAVVGYAQTTGTLGVNSKNRDIANATLVNTVTPYIQGLMPEHVAVTVTTVSNSPIDVSFGLSLPSAPTASPPGPGGGWLDGAPWPAISGSSFLRGEVLSVVTSPAAPIDPTNTTFVVYAPTSPVANSTHISWLSPSTWTLYSGTVTSVTNPASNQWQITVSTPFVGIFAGCYVFPTAVNTAAYVSAALSAFASMGPGEKSSNASVLQRGFRHPVPQLSWPYSMGAQQLRTITNAGTEVLDVQYYYRALTTPNLPGSITDPPTCFVPHHIGFYPL